MRDIALVHGETTDAIIGAFYAAYNELRFGFLESVYAAALTELLRESGRHVEREVWTPVLFRGREIARQRLDMVVNRCVVVEIKSTEVLHPTAHRQLQSYLTATQFEVGMLLHFGPEARFYRARRRGQFAAPRSIRTDPVDPIRSFPLPP